VQNLPSVDMTVFLAIQLYHKMCGFALFFAVLSLLFFFAFINNQRLSVKLYYFIMLILVFLAVTGLDVCWSLKNGETQN
jgi:heme A synthase